MRHHKCRHTAGRSLCQFSLCPKPQYHRSPSKIAITSSMELRATRATKATISQHGGANPVFRYGIVEAGCACCMSGPKLHWWWKLWWSESCFQVRHRRSRLGRRRRMLRAPPKPKDLPRWQLWWWWWWSFHLISRKYKDWLMIFNKQISILKDHENYS